MGVSSRRGGSVGGWFSRASRNSIVEVKNCELGDGKPRNESTIRKERRASSRVGKKNCELGDGKSRDESPIGLERRASSRVVKDTGTSA